MTQRMRLIERTGFLSQQLVHFGQIGQPEDIAKVIVNLLPDNFGWVTARDIEVSGKHLL